jgi:hypothetical protein
MYIHDIRYQYRTPTGNTGPRTIKLKVDMDNSGYWRANWKTISKNLISIQTGILASDIIDDSLHLDSSYYVDPYSPISNSVPRHSEPEKPKWVDKEPELRSYEYPELTRAMDKIHAEHVAMVRERNRKEQERNKKSKLDIKLDKFFNEMGGKIESFTTKLGEKLTNNLKRIDDTFNAFFKDIL